METEAEILVETTEVPAKRSFFGLSINKIVIIVVIVAIIAAFVIVGFLVVFKYLGIFGTRKEQPSKGCKNCKDKKTEKIEKPPDDNSINEIDKLISENNTKIMENEAEVPNLIEERQNLLNVEVKNEDNVIIDEMTSTESEELSSSL